ncbi:MAG: efflux RND transporter periplasmic adaptor subunit [Planctomycetaceae bacterium]|jgi:cobalt-zinc-cadmium efflux system membrane fusion protein|nr:efflux RND transporter periplasmic adaptor subunit [Planctomycetaceae bacterium]
MSIPTLKLTLETARHKHQYRRAVFNAVPNIAVFFILGGVMFLGHHTGWKMPKFSEITGTGSAAADDWCSEHLVPESQCLECHPELYPRNKEFGFCREHGVAECVLHHPELSQTRNKPSLPQYDTFQAISLRPRAENNSRNTLHTHRVQFASHESVVKAGIEVDIVTEAPMTDFVTANGELVFDPNHVGVLSSKVPGTVAAVFKTTGGKVESGGILALIDASQVGQLKSELMKNLVQLQLRKKTVERLQPISASGVVPGKNLLEAESALRETETALLSTCQLLTNLGFEIPGGLEINDTEKLAGQLQFLGIPVPIVETLSPGTKTANLIPVRAPFDGTVIASDVVAGTVAETSKPLFTVCDTRKMRIMLNVRQEDAGYIRQGLTVHFQPDNGGRETSGTVSWISPSVDLQTRTLQVRAEVENPDGLLLDKTYGSGRIILREEPNAVVVPKEAVQSTPDSHFVFVRDKNYFDETSPKFFHVRQVRIGAENGRNVELLAGVLPGEVIAAAGSNVLLAHLLRANLGAGCCAED